jgi:hypothetical protein
VIGARPQLLRDQIPCPIAHAFLDIVAGDDEVLAILAHTAHDQMDVGMFGVPVIDGDAIELGAEVLFHLPDRSRKGLRSDITKASSGEDEPEMMPVVLAPLRERLSIGIVRAGSTQPGFLSVPGDALAAQIAEVGRKRRAASAVTNDARLDDGAARA